MLLVLLSTVVLYFLIEKMAGDDSPVRGKRVIGIVAAAFAVQLVLGLFSKSLMWQTLSLLAPGIVVWLALYKWCGLGRALALKIAALYTAANFLLSLVVGVAFALLTRP